MPGRAARKRAVVSLILIGDILATVVAVIAAYWLRFRTGWFPFEGSPPVWSAYGNALLVVVPCYLYFFREYGLYQTTRYVRRIEEIFLVAKAATASVVLLMALTFFYRNFTYSRIYLAVLWGVSIIVLSAFRYCMIQLEYARKSQKHEMQRVLLIGANRHSRNLIAWARSNRHYGREIIGILARDPALEGKLYEGVRVLGLEREYEKKIDEIRPDEVILLDSGFRREEIANLVALCEDRFVEFRIVADFFGLLTRNVAVENISSVPLLGFRALPLDDPLNRFLKRTFDLGVALALLVLTFPVWLALMIVIKLEDRGPVLYKQERMGRDGRTFKLLKFRTMKVDAEKTTGPVWARQNDRRRTRSGNLLRRFNLDELPQLWNVLKGDMSLVGPRPERPHFIEQFRGAIPRYMARHRIRAGITGWAQVNGLRGNTSIEERIKYDLYYMENWSLLFDIEILFMTLTNRGFKNAY